MNSPEHQKYLDELAAEFSFCEPFTELCRRVAEAVTTQDSCGRCEADTIKAKLYTGEDGIMVCASCSEEIAVLSVSNKSP
jgi:hypothetical protein